MTAPRSRSDPTRRALLAGAAALAVAGAAGAGGGLVVLAAASLKPALDDILTGWPGPVAVSYLGSGTAARQAAAGAPADLVILAATDWMDWLETQGALAGPAVPVAGNRLVLVGPPGAAPLALERDALLARLGPAGRIALGDPMSVPAGRYAQQALETLGLWETLRPRAVLAENVRAALAYVARGDLALGVVYGSDARGTGVAELVAVPPESHRPIVYPAALLRGAAPGARALLDRIVASGAVFAAHGFAPAPAA
ncbi:molybdate ABC transporter substrate-binding protein [Jannaschia ovalis]|uniref:Molybdate ABC transporter substrate-binding protein n=1 Tax=Jannaschia ovalis TaxID=3038773 RepID=A0ABY8LE42_9RHOB|nr:molybdate ABC transporter substrate-binding protein [Jannaschia sp. GRR-S6-38]WGH78887.1 molybdate ABC transporter substrate-binding protein [Jannaschia sp. GRR-S6-38]